MKEVKKISLILVFIVLFMVCLNSSVYAALSSKANLSVNKSELNPEEEFNVTFNISDVVGDKGVIALSGTLKYDKNVLELVNKSGSNNWNKPSLNEENGKFATERESLGKSNEEVFTLTFKVKKGATGSTAITVEDIMISDGDVEEKVAKVSKAITIKAKDGENNNSSDDTINIPTSSSKDNNTNQDKKPTTTLPKTGEGSFTIVASIMAIGFVVIAFVCYKKVNKYI